MRRVVNLAFLLVSLTTIFAAAQPAAESQAVSIGLVLDTSGSMRPKMGLARELLSRLIQDAAPQDEIALIEASDHPVVLSGFGSDMKALLAYANPTEARGGSALFDALFLGAQLTGAGRHEPKVLVLITDGGDDGSKLAKEDVEWVLQREGVRAFVIALGGADSGSPLAQLAEGAGGRHFGVRDAADLSRIAEALRGAMRSSKQ